MVRQPGSFWRSGAFWARLGAGIAMLLLIVFAGVVYWLRSNARAQREAVAAIKADGGQVTYPWDDSEAAGAPIAFRQSGLRDWLMSWAGPSDESAELGPAAPSWLVSLLGVDCFGDVTSVVMPHPNNQ